MPGKRSRNAAIAVGPISSLLDAINLQLLRELQEHPRQTIATLARRIGMSAPAVAERIQRLQEAGMIAGTIRANSESRWPCRASSLRLRLEHGLYIQDWRSVQRLQVLHPHPSAIDRHDRHPVQPDRVRAIGRTCAEHALRCPRRISS